MNAIVQMLRRILPRRRVIADRRALASFVASESAFVSQKCTVEYCRARSGLNWDKLFKERAFAEAMDVCRWEAYGAVLSDMAVVAEGKLRGSVAHGGDLAEALTGVVAEALDAFGRPAYRDDWASAWTDAIGRRLAQAALGPFQPAHEVAKAAAAIVYDVLPMHPSVRVHDRELVTNNLRFALSRSASNMEERFDAPAICRDLLLPAAG
jgi:hypothetical protein